MTDTMAAHRTVGAPSRNRLSPMAGHCAIVAFLIALSLRLRLGGLAPPTLWRDDTWVAIVHRAPAVKAMYMGFSAPGFNLLLREWFAVVGFSELRAQLPALIVGTVAPTALYLVALRMRLRWSTALLGAVLLAASTPYVLVSVRVKQYSFDALAALIVLWLAWRVVEHPDDGRRWAWLAGAAVVMVAVSAAAITIVVGSFAVALFAAWRAGSVLRRPVVTAIAAVGAFGAAWWLIFLRRARSASLQRFWSPAMIQARPARGFLPAQSFWGSANQRITDVLQHFLPFTVHRTLLILAAFIAAAVLVGLRRPLLLMLLATPFVIAVALSMARVTPLGVGVIPVNGSRIDVYLYPSLALLLAAGVDQAVQVIEKLVRVRAGGLAGWVAPAIILVAVLAVLASTSVSSYPRSDTKTFIRYLDANARPGDTIVMIVDARYQYEPYTRWPISIQFTKANETGFIANVSPPGVEIVEFHVGEAAPTSARAFLLASRFQRNSHSVLNWLGTVGYRRAWGREASNATLDLWVK